MKRLCAPDMVHSDARRMALVAGLLGLSLFYAVSPVSAQQEKRLIVSRSVPDSISRQLSDTVDMSRVQRNWGKLRKGMPPEEVERIFGKPNRIASSMYDDSTTWYYEDHYVVFDNIKGKVRWWNPSPPASR